MREEGSTVLENEFHQRVGPVLRQEQDVLEPLAISQE